MTTRNATCSRSASGTPTEGITLTFEPWMLAEIRRQLYLDLMESAEHFAKEAHGAAESGADPNHDKVVGVDLRHFVHKTIGDTATILDAIGWDVDGDTALLMEHGKATDREKGLTN